MGDSVLMQNKLARKSKKEVFKVHKKRATITYLKQTGCSPHSVSASKFQRDLFILKGYISLSSTGEPF